MNFLAIILLTFTAVGPLSARAMIDSETTYTDVDTTCIWGACGSLPCPRTPVVGSKSCVLGDGTKSTQYCCGTGKKAL
ncbi:hypothetical protein BDR03DRAFT_957991 [Suillus americanus]|nr:hypothetical protein BDR03DRAFT_957991 [Suillus americanus]